MKRRIWLKDYLRTRFLLIAFASLGAALLYVLFVAEPYLVDQINSRNAWMAYYISQSIDSQLQREEGILTTIAAGISEEGLLTESNADEDMSADEENPAGGDSAADGNMSASHNQLVQAFSRLVEEDPELDALLVLDAQGIVIGVDTAHEGYLGLDLSRKEWYRADMEPNRPIWTSVFMSTMLSRPATACMIRIGDRMLVGIMNLDSYNMLVKGMEMPEGTHVDILDGKSRYIVGHSMREVNSQTVYEQMPSGGFTGPNGTWTYLWEGHRQIGNYNRMLESDWVVSVSTQRWSISRIAWMLLGYVSLMLLAIVAALLVLLTRLNRKWISEFNAIEKQLHQLAEGNRDDSGDPASQPRFLFRDFDSLVKDFSGLLDTAHMAEEEALEKTREAESANQAKNRFLEGVSREIRNPMNGILGVTDLLLFRETDDEKLMKLRLLRRSAEMLQRTMDDVLQITNLESGALTIQLLPVRLGMLLEETLNLHAEAASRKGIALTMKWDRSLAEPLMADGLRIQQLLGHLVDNAVKFTEEGLVRITAHADSWRAEAADVVFSVRDTGVGIDPAEQQRIFEDFHQIHGKGGAQQRGIGLGLPICRRLISGMGGTITLESEPGKGSEFRFMLTLQRCGSADGTPSASTMNKESAG